MKLFIIFFFGISLSINAQEAKYKATLDSLANYIRFTKSESEKSFRLLSYYQPGMFNAMSEKTDSSIFFSMTKNEKTKVVFTDGNEIYMADLKQMDTTMISPTRGIRFYDVNGKVKFRKSYIARIFNGKHGGVETDYFILKMVLSQENKVYFEKLMVFQKDAILFSKDVVTLKSDLREVEIE